MSIGQDPILGIDGAVETAVWALNNQHAAELSWLEPERLKHLLAQAFYARRIGDLDAFMIAFDQDADYDSPNYLWFRARYPICLCRPHRRRAVGARPRPRAAAL